MDSKRVSRWCNWGLIGVLPLALSIHLSGCDTLHPTTDAEHIAKAKEYQDQGDEKSSIIELKSALQKNPDNPEARRLLGEIHAKNGNGPDAEKELRKAVELGVAKTAVLTTLSETLVQQGKYQAVLDEVSVPDDLDAESKARLYTYRGDAWLALNKTEQAREEYERALQTVPDAPLAKVGLARLALADKQPDKAKQLVAEAIAAAPDEARLWSFQAQLLEVLGDLEKAEESYGKAIDLRRANQFDRAARAVVRLNLKKTAQAAQDVEVLKKEAPEFYLTHYADGLLLIGREMWPEAQSALEQSLKLNDRYVPTYYFLALSHLQQGHVEQAEQVLGRFMTALPGSVKGHQAMALVLFLKKDYPAAKKYLEPVLAYSPDDVASLRLMANIELALGNSGEALVHLQRAVELDPKSPVLQTQLGIGLIGAGEQEKGLKALKAAVENDPNFTQAEVFMALAHIKTKEFAKAQAVIDQIKAKMPDQPLPYDLQGLAYQAMGKNDEARQAFAKVLEIAPQDLAALSALAQMAVHDEDYPKARALLERIVKAHPKHVPAYLALAELSVREGRGSELEGYLTEAVEVAPKSLPPRLILANLYTRFGQAQKAIALLEAVHAEHGQNPDFLATLIEAQFERNMDMQALENAKALVKIAPDKALSHFLLARAHAEAGDGKRMRAALEKSLQLDPTFPRSRIAMVRLLAQEKKTAEAEKILSALLKEYPDNPEVLGLKGWFALKQRKPQEAIEAYAAALQKFPSSGLSVNLAKAQWAAGEKEAALKTLASWNEQYPKDGYVRYFRSGLLNALGRVDEAKAQLKVLLENQPDNVLALNDLAWLLRKDAPAQALEHAEKAVSLAPKSAPILDTLAVILLEKGQSERALSLLEQANSYASNIPSLRYHLALAYQKNARQEEASKILRELLEEKTVFQERKEAENLLRQLQ